MTYDIFISYRRSDRELVAAVVQRLEARGVDVWYDAEIEGGADWRETIVKALSNSRMLVVFFSEGCNTSRQIGKELAIADSLAMPVAPVLIENTQPRGACLHELANRNWIRVWPEPMDHIDHLVEHLATLAGKTAGRAAGAPASSGARAARGMPAAANDGVPAPAANDDNAEENLDQAVSAFIEAASPPTAAKAYVGRVGADGKPERKLADIPPFRLIDLAILAPAWLAIAGWQIASVAGAEGLVDTGRTLAAIALFCLAFAGLYGALVFPVRYYLRRRPVVDALLKYLATCLMFFVAAAAIILVGMDRGYFQTRDMLDFLRVAALAWAGFTLVVFMVYGALAGQRAIRSFRSNIRTL